ncbi:hypothetical protein B0H11DRAFT_1708391 [Mycena galericulata]|nr:hypothetical protein B0H11DRAFT_1708391 [Mycena galericulata]
MALSKRRGGGKTSGSKGGEGGDSDGSSGGTTKTVPIKTSGTSKTATSYGEGGGKVITIPSGQLFSGRPEGSGTRAQVFGTRTFGSGYPGISGRGVAGRGFPFFFWPLSFGAVGGVGGGAYLRSDTEYGHADNTSRPGGVMMTAAFQSNSTNASTFRILADNSTVVDLISDITANCSASLSSTAVSPSPYNDTATLPPQPEQVVQYYRASSIALSLDGYNNTAIFEAEGTPDVALPTGIDTTLLDCLNQTIGLAAPLIGGTGSRWADVPNNASLFALIWLAWFFSTFT